MDWLTDNKIPVGDWGDAFFQFLTDYFYWFFDGLSLGIETGLDAMIDGTLWLHPLLVVALIAGWAISGTYLYHAVIGLDAVAGAFEEAGLSAVLCYEVTDRNGRAEATAGIEENLRFLDAHRDDPRIRGVFGLHASFTLRDETLEAVARRRNAGDGCHIHVAEDPIDVSASKAAFGVGPVERLERFGLLDERALLAHGIHLEPPAYEAVARHGATVIHNPESNNNNGVGRLDTVAAAGHGCRIGLGTDGMSSAVQRALRSAFLTHRGATRDPSSGFEVLPGLLETNVEIARRFFGEPLLGSLVPGAPADVIVVDAPPPTRLGPDNFFGHLVYGLSEAPVRHTVARGRLLLEDFHLLAVDPAATAERARRLSPALWRRFHDLDWGTPHLGDV